jgi:hypothetical protein
VAARSILNGVGTQQQRHDDAGSQESRCQETEAKGAAVAAAAPVRRAFTGRGGWLAGWLAGWLCSPVHRDAIPLDWLLGVRGNERVVDTDRVADERARSDGEGRAGHTWTAAVLDVALTLNDVPKL